MSAPEKRDLLLLGMDLSAGLKMILGIATSSISEAVWLAKQAAKAGAEAVLVMPPSYFTEASQDGIARWFERLCEDGGCPVLVYNFPKRSGIRFEPETLSRLASNPLVLGFKDSSGERDNLALYRQFSLGKQLYVGDETLLSVALDAGWNGTISGAANVLGHWISEILGSWESGNESARAKFELILPAIQALRGIPQPGGNKAMLERLAVIKQVTLRAPLSSPPAEAVEAAWAKVSPLLDLHR